MALAVRVRWPAGYAVRPIRPDDARLKHGQVSTGVFGARPAVQRALERVREGTPSDVPHREALEALLGEDLGGSGARVVEDGALTAVTAAHVDMKVKGSGLSLKS